MYVARDKDGHLFIWNKLPYRGYDAWEYIGALVHWLEIDSSLFPNLKWEDEPIEIELVPKMMNAVQDKLAESIDNYFDYVCHVQDINPYSKEQEQNYYDDMCWRWQDWNTIKYDHPSTWDLNFDDYING